MGIGAGWIPGVPLEVAVGIVVVGFALIAWEAVSSARALLPWTRPKLTLGRIQASHTGKDVVTNRDKFGVPSVYHGEHQSVTVALRNESDKRNRHARNVLATIEVRGHEFLDEVAAYQPRAHGRWLSTDPQREGAQARRRDFPPTGEEEVLEVLGKLYKVSSCWVVPDHDAPERPDHRQANIYPPGDYELTLVLRSPDFRKPQRIEFTLRNPGPNGFVKLRQKED